jgi:hypothetical protein
MIEDDGASAHRKKTDRQRRKLRGKSDDQPADLTCRWQRLPELLGQEHLRQ